MDEVFYDEQTGIKWFLCEDGGIKPLEGARTKKSIIIPKYINKKEVKYILKDAFNNCYWLENIKLHENIDCVGENAFKECYELSEINFPNSLRWVEENAFKSCYGLKTVILPESVEYIGAGAFSGCYSIKKVKIPKLIKRIEAAVFSNCYELTSVKLPDSLEYIGKGAFEFTDLLSIDFPETLKMIDADAFCACYRMNKVYIPKNVNYIGNDAFRETNIKIVTFDQCYDLISFYKGKPKQPFSQTFVKEVVIKIDEDLEYNLPWSYDFSWYELFNKDEGGFSLENYRNAIKTAPVLERAIVKMQYLSLNLEDELTTFFKTIQFRNYLTIYKYFYRKNDKKSINLLLNLKEINRSSIDKIIKFTQEENNIEETLRWLDYKNTQFKEFAPNDNEFNLKSYELTITEFRKLWEFTTSEKNIYIKSYKGKDKNIYIPAEVRGRQTVVLEGAFELKNFSKQKQEMYKEIKGIIFESSVIYTHASFSEMESLRYVKLPSTVELVTNESFRGCKNLITCQIYKSSLKLPKDIFRDNEAFEGVIYIE